MASTSGQVTLHGRFAPGTQVRLVKVRDESVLRAEGGKEVATATVDDDGRVQFKSGVEVGGRYFICGHDRGEPREVRVRGSRADDESTVLSQQPVGNVAVKTAGGAEIDVFGRVTAPEREKAPGPEVAPGPAQHQVPEGTVQRSDTPLGFATPVDPGEVLPYPAQRDTGKSDVQRSDTEAGQATPIPPAHPERQEDVQDGELLQRSDTPHGVTTPIPSGDAVQAQLERDSSAAKAMRGEPVKAAARTPEKPAKGASKAPARKRSSAKKSSGRKAAAKSSSSSAGSSKSNTSKRSK
jgi:hypothetical protein